MPSPVGHALGAVAAGWTVARPASDRRALVIQTAIFATVGMAPDLDLLLHRHSGETHSIGAAVLVATLAAWGRWPVGTTRALTWCAVFVAYATHPLLDALSFDTSPPIGVMAFWPLSMRYMQTGWSIFGPISRSWGTEEFWDQNLHSLARELLLLTPVVALVWWARKRRHRTS